MGDLFLEGVTITSREYLERHNLLALQRDTNQLGQKEALTAQKLANSNLPTLFGAFLFGGKSFSLSLRNPV
jgi:hypothetical protein